MAHNGTNPQSLTAKQEKAIAALLTEATVAKAADVAGVGLRTLWRWLDDAAFAAAYRQARRNAVQQATARLQQTSWAAVSVLVQVMVDTKTPASVRVAAASKVLDLAIRAVELEDLQARIEALEALYEHRK